MNTKKSYHRSVIAALAILFAVILFTLRDDSVVSAQLAAQPLDVASRSSIDFPVPESTGKLLAPDCQPTGGSGGLAPGRYETDVAGLKASVVVGKGYQPGTPTYLAFFIHGDGGRYQSFQKVKNPVTQFVDSQNWIFVAPQSPNAGDSWWQNMNGDHVEALAKVLDQMFAQYNVCRNVIFGSSGSGGSEFWTSFFFPAKGGQYPAHMLIGCGGSGGGGSNNRQRIQALGKDSNIVARSSFYYVYGSIDRLVPMITKSIDVYSNAGFKVYVEKIEGAGHCNKWKDQGLPNLDEQAVNKWQELAAQVGAN